MSQQLHSLYSLLGDSCKVLEIGGLNQSGRGWGIWVPNRDHKHRLVQNLSLSLSLPPLPVFPLFFLPATVKGQFLQHKDDLTDPTRKIQPSSSAARKHPIS